MMTDETLHHRVVLSVDGLNVGEVTRLIIDPQQLRIAALEVRLHRQVAERLGLARGMFRGPSIQIPSEQVQSIGDVVILAVPIDRLADGMPRDAPAHQADAPAGP